MFSRRKTEARKGRKELQRQQKTQPLKLDFYKAKGFHPTAGTALCATEIFCYKGWIISAQCGHQTFDSHINKPCFCFPEQFPDFLSPLMPQHTKPLSKPRKEIFYSWVQSPAEFWEAWGVSSAVHHMESVTSPQHNKLGRRCTGNGQCVWEEASVIHCQAGICSQLCFVHSSCSIQWQEVTS